MQICTYLLTLHYLFCLCPSWGGAKRKGGPWPQIIPLKKHNLSAKILPSIANRRANSFCKFIKKKSRSSYDDKFKVQNTEIPLSNSTARRIWRGRLPKIKNRLLAAISSEFPFQSQYMNAPILHAQSPRIRTEHVVPNNEPGVTDAALKDLILATN